MNTPNTAAAAPRIARGLPPFDAALVAADQAAAAAEGGVAAEGASPADERPACGWFDSSWALRQGLAVSELPDSDGSVAALWFAQLAPAGSAAWQ